VSVSAEGYSYQTLHSKEPCTVCLGLGMRYPAATRGGWPAVVLTTLAYLAETTLRCIDWCAKQVGADGASLRTWLERDIGALGKKTSTMPCTKTFLCMLTVVAVCGLATLTLPLSAQAGARVSIGIGIPVSPAPVVVAPAPAVVYPAPVIVPPPVVYGAPPVWVQGPYGHRHRPWRHHHHRWHRW
jgi:hypothetical protein